MRWHPGTSTGAAGVREPAVAGQFYAGSPDRLIAEVDHHLAVARAELARRAAVVGAGSRLVAVVAPHAGHVYSGPVAGFAYAAIDPAEVRRVVLLGPAHFVPVDGIGLSTASAWRTPLGDVPLDAQTAEDLRAHVGAVVPADRAHDPEHSLEVQLPFLQRVLHEGWQLVPLIVGADVPEEVAAVIARVSALPGTLVVVSTDLSHYLDHDAAVARDARTIDAVLARRAADIGPYDACGRYPLRGLLLAADRHDWDVTLLDARNSGDTAGGWDRVVGYAALAVTGAARVDPASRGGHGADAWQVPHQHHEPGQGAGRPGVGGQGSGASGGDGVGGEAAGARSDGDDAPGPGGDHDREPREDSHPGPVEGGGTGDAGRIGPQAREALLSLARRTIDEGLRTGRRPRLDPSAWEDADPVLSEPGAAFVTLRSATGELLGCIGSLSARQPLVADVAEHAFDAAFRDPRFPPMTASRADGMVVDISVLTPARPFPCAGYAELLERVPVGRGLVVEAGLHRATFLPAVWEQLPTPAAFLAALWRKAGLAPGAWPAGTTIEVYDTEEFAEQPAGTRARPS